MFDCLTSSLSVCLSVRMYLFMYLCLMFIYLCCFAVNYQNYVPLNVDNESKYFSSITIIIITVVVVVIVIF